MDIRIELKELFKKHGGEPENCSAFVSDAVKMLSMGMGSDGYNAIVRPHFDEEGMLDGGDMFENCVCIGHADPRGKRGHEGQPGKEVYVHK